jgi:hypothetical protein
VLSLSDILQGAQLLVQIFTGRRTGEVVMTHGQPRQPMDIRVIATAFVWVCTTGILLIWMVGIFLLFAVGANGETVEAIQEVAGPAFLIPMIALVVAAISTNKIWKAPISEPPALPPNREKQLEERLANLETIITREASRSERSANNL